MGLKRPWHEVQARVALKLVRVVVSHFLADWLLCNLVDVLIVADVDSSMNEEQVDQLAVVLLNDLC